MVEHKQKGEELITSLLMACLEHPVSVYLDSKEGIIYTSQTIKESNEMWRNRRYIPVIELTRNTPAMMIRNSLTQAFQEIEKDFSVYTSLSSHAERIQRNTDWEK